jgi:transcriptional regulator with XRE-family HTH domain
LAKSLRSRDHRALLAVLRATRADKGLTQRQLAARLGWNKSKYAAVESGERRLDVVEFKHVAKALKVDPIDLFRRFADW